MKKLKNLDTMTRKNHKRKLGLKKNVSAWILMLPMVIILYLFVWRPTVLGAVQSFFNMRGYTVTDFCGFDNYRRVLTHTQFLPMLWNTVQYVFWSLIIGFLPPIFIAIMINEIVHFKGGFRVLIYLPALIPGIAAMLMWYYMYYPDQTGLLNMILGIFGVEPQQWLNNPHFAIIGIIIYTTWKSFPAAMLLYYASVQSVSVELYEAAMIDGAGPLRRLWHITRPAMEGIILLQFVRQIINVFQIMEQPLAMTGGGPNNASVTLGLLNYRYAFENGGRNAQYALALGVMMFIFLSIVAILYFRLDKKIQENQL